MNALFPRALWAALLLLSVAGAAHAFLTDCARPLMLGEVKMKDASLEEAVACIKTAAAKIEGFESSHFNIVLRGAAPDPAKRLSLDLKQVPLKLVLEEVARTFSLRMRIEPYAVVLDSLASSEPIYTRVYRVPPDFLQTGSAGK